MAQPCEVIDIKTAQPLALAGGGDPPHDGGMEARVAKLEQTMADVRERIASVEAKVDSIDRHGAKSADISSLESRMIRWFVGTALAIGSIAFAIAKFVT